jgi:hypothetical protein
MLRVEKNIERTPWNPSDYDIPRGTSVQDCLAHAIYWFDQLTRRDAERYKEALRLDKERTSALPTQPETETQET